MKTINLAFNKDVSDEELENIITSLNKNLSVTEDSDGISLRFITIDAQLVNIDINDLGIIIRDICMPHHFVSIPKKFIWRLEIRL